MGRFWILVLEFLDLAEVRFGIMQSTPDGFDRDIAVLARSIVSGELAQIMKMKLDVGLLVKL